MSGTDRPIPSAAAARETRTWFARVSSNRRAAERSRRRDDSGSLAELAHRGGGFIDRDPLDSRLVEAQGRGEPADPGADNRAIH